MADKNWGYEVIVRENYNKLSIPQLHQLCKSKGYDITESAIQKLVRSNKVNNTFVSDLAKYSYSDFIEARIQNCIMASEKIKKIMNESANNSVIIQAAKTLHKCEIDLATLVSSDILKISATNWAHYVRDLENKIEKLKSKTNLEKLNNE